MLPDAVQRMQGVSIESRYGWRTFVAVRGTPIQWTSSTLNGNRMPSASRWQCQPRSPDGYLSFGTYSECPFVQSPDSGSWWRCQLAEMWILSRKPSPNKETLAINIGFRICQHVKIPIVTTRLSSTEINITDRLKFITSAVIWERSTAIDQMRNIYKLWSER